MLRPSIALTIEAIKKEISNATQCDLKFPNPNEKQSTAFSGNVYLKDYALSLNDSVFKGTLVAYTEYGVGTFYERLKSAEHMKDNKTIFGKLFLRIANTYHIGNVPEVEEIIEFETLTKMIESNYNKIKEVYVG